MQITMCQVLFKAANKKTWKRKSYIPRGFRVYLNSSWWMGNITDKYELYNDQSIPLLLVSNFKQCFIFINP